MSSTMLAGDFRKSYEVILQLKKRHWRLRGSVRMFVFIFIDENLNPGNTTKLYSSSTLLAP